MLDAVIHCALPYSPPPSCPHTHLRLHRHLVSALQLGALMADIAFAYVSDRFKFAMSAVAGLIGVLVTTIFLPDTTGMDLHELDRWNKYVLAGEADHYHGTRRWGGRVVRFPPGPQHVRNAAALRHASGAAAAAVPPPSWDSCGRLRVLLLFAEQAKP